MSETEGARAHDPIRISESWRDKTVRINSGALVQFPRFTVTLTWRSESKAASSATLPRVPDPEWCAGPSALWAAD